MQSYGFVQGVFHQRLFLFPQRFGFGFQADLVKAGFFQQRHQADNPAVFGTRIAGNGYRKLGIGIADSPKLADDSSAGTSVWPM